MPSQIEDGYTPEQKASILNGRAKAKAKDDLQFGAVILVVGIALICFSSQSFWFVAGILGTTAGAIFIAMGLIGFSKVKIDD